MSLDSTLGTESHTADADRILCECDLEILREFVTALEAEHAVEVESQPSVGLAMIPAEDSLERQRFYLGEALATECVVRVDGLLGYGLCLGDEPVRTYCMAVLDAMLHGGRPAPAEIKSFLAQQGAAVEGRQAAERALILQTHVDFKLMEEA